MRSLRALRLGLAITLVRILDHDGLAQAPARPTNLVVVAASASQLDVTWTDASTNETGFKIERRRGSGSWSQIATAARNATTYTDSGLVSGAQYTYRVRAYNSVGNSAYATSSQVTARS